MYRGLWEMQAMRATKEMRKMDGSRKGAQEMGHDPVLAEADPPVTQLQLK